MARIGIYGSEFDPITYTHLWTAQAIVNRRKLDKVIFVPSSDKKTGHERPLTCNEHRWNMIQLAIQTNPLFEADRIELDAAVWENYTYQTLCYFKEKYPNDEIFFIMGADNLEHLSKWNQAEALIKENKFIIMAREGYDMLSTIANDSLLRKYELDSFDLIHKGLSININSSFVRDEIAIGSNPRYLLPDECLEYIKEHKLYIEEN